MRPKRPDLVANYNEFETDAEGSFCGSFERFSVASLKAGIVGGHNVTSLKGLDFRVAFNVFSEDGKRAAGICEFSNCETYLVIAHPLAF